MGLSLSSSYQNQDFFDPKSTFRKAGEVFEPKSSTPDSSLSRSMIADMYQDDDKNSSNANSTDPGQKFDTGWTDSTGGKVFRDFQPLAEQKPSSTPELGTYDEDKYKYYVSPTNETGASAYGEQMEKYNGMVKMNSEGLSAGHLGLVASMMHPDWQDHNFNGTYGQINSNADYSSPNNARYQKYEQQKRKLESVGGGQSKGKY